MTALAGLETLLTDHLRVLGPDRPETLKVRGELAYWHGETGDGETAQAEYRSLLADLLRLFGPEHPHTVAVQNTLAERETRASPPTGQPARQPARLDLTTAEEAAQAAT